MKAILPTTLLLLFVLNACKSADPVMQVCEQSDRECTMRCMQSTSMQTTASYPYSTMAYQVASFCEDSCEANYQGCLQRRENKSIRMISANVDNLDYRLVGE